jgi:predicted nucleotidyltransferase
MAVTCYSRKVLKFNPQVQPTPRDYLQTKEGLMFAVVNAEPILSDRIVCCLRYIPTTDGLRKITTSDAIAYLQANHPQYLYHFEQLDTLVHAVPMSAIQCHYQPVSRLQQICEQPLDGIEESTAQVAVYFISQGIDSDSLGMSGSILISAHGAKSDIDLVVYGRDNFFKARNSLQQLFMSHQAQHSIQPLSDEQWQQTWQRRGCDLSLQDYIWHEQRKYNKASINGIKFDLSMVESSVIDNQAYKKQGMTSIKAVITDDSKAYDYPASYLIDHPEINQILSYSATYAGQACHGETIEARGIVEKSLFGHCRLLVGASREATGQYLKVVKPLCSTIVTS